jgi:hypothetical protein
MKTYYNENDYQTVKGELRPLDSRDEDFMKYNIDPNFGKKMMQKINVDEKLPSDIEVKSPDLNNSEKIRDKIYEIIEQKIADRNIKKMLLNLLADYGTAIINEVNKIESVKL